MTTETYTKEYKKIREWYAAGMLTVGECIDRTHALNAAYVKGKGSFLLPVVV